MQSGRQRTSSKEVFLGKVNEGSDGIRVVRDETSVEVGKAEEGSYIPDFLGCWPPGDAV